MVKINKILSEDDIKAIENEISSVEGVSSGEIVPVIAHRSSSYKTVEAMNAFILAYLFMFIAYYVHGSITPLGMLLYTVVGMVVIVTLFFFDFFKRILIPKRLMYHKVREAALSSFYRNGVYKTKKRTGILIYISLMERMVVVIGDEGIHAKVGDEAWNDVIKIIVHGIKHKHLKQGVIDGIESCRDLLKTHFPNGSGDTNELSNRVIYE